MFDGLRCSTRRCPLTHSWMNYKTQFSCHLEGYTKIKLHNCTFFNDVYYSLRHFYLIIFSSYQFVNAVGTSRWSEVVINREQQTIGVEAWCMEDAMEALQQVRSSVTASPTLDTIATLSVHTNLYRDEWGQPPSSPVSTELAAELQHWSDRCNRYCCCRHSEVDCISGLHYMYK